MEQNHNRRSQGAARWLWRVAGKYRGCVAGLMLMEAALGASGVAYAMLFREMIDGAAAGRMRTFVWAAVLLAGLTLAQMILDALGSLLAEWTRATVENRLKSRLFDCLLHKDFATVKAKHSGEWVSRLTSDTVVVANGLVNILPGLAGMLARLAGALGMLLYLQPAFVYVVLPAGLAVLAVTTLLRKVLKRLHKQIQEASGAVLSFLQERLESMMIVHVFAMEERTGQQAAQKMEAHKAARLRRNHFSNLCYFGFGGIVNGGYLLAAVYCGYGIMQGTISYGTFAAVLQLVGQVQSPVAGITGVVPQYYAMTASAERLMEAEAYPDDGGETPVPAREIARFYRESFESLGVRGASFSYRTFEGESHVSERLAVIDGLDLEVRKGEYVAFTGHSGCGKSTLLKLLMCLYPLDKGQRYLKARTAAGPAEYPLTAAWRGLFAYVPQGNQLMSGTIREIVAFGEPAAMRQEQRLWRALEVACADGFVRELEHGLDTALGEHGSGLSEGQMQRIAIARAVFSERPILILDECTSSLDEDTEQKLLTNLRRMTQKTVLIITHRPAALSICDRQVEMVPEGRNHA